MPCVRLVAADAVCDQRLASLWCTVIAQQLTAQLDQLQAELPEITALPETAYAQKIVLRGRAISLMNTCAQAAIIAASGAANMLGHPAQRVYKESLVFSVSGQTTAGAIASLSYLTSAPPA